MKYSSHEGRCGKLLAASAIMSTGRSGTAGTVGASGVGFGIAGRLMKVRRTLDSSATRGNLPCENLTRAPPRMQRTVQPEILDSLPHDHPDALHNRRDLRLTNFVTGDHRWL